MESDNLLEQHKTNSILHKKDNSRWYHFFVSTLVSLISVVIIFTYTVLQAPKDFPIYSFVVYEKDQYIGQLAEELKEKKYIRSTTLFKLFLFIYGNDTSVPAGQYFFDTRGSVNTIAHQFATGDFNQKKVKITIPEGSTVEQIALIIHNKIPSIDRKSFSELAKGQEGFLFPDTYFFYQNVTTPEIIAKMKQTYDEKVEPIFEGLSIKDEQQRKIIILASILEEEGKSEKDRRLIAGILLNRLEADIPLQVDATINYIKRAAGDVSFKDLELDSPYNTYKNKGLPPGPISSPGLEAILDALSPTKTNYFYYLTGSDGVFYYAKTFEEHVRNKERYLQ